MRKVRTLCVTLLLMLALAIPAFAAQTPYVTDDALLLTASQREALNDYAERISETYGIGIYFITVDDFRDYGEESHIFDVLWNYYHANSLGFGPDREGMILMLSMAERDFATFFYGENTEYAFDSYGQQQLEGYFLDDFGNNDWYNGFYNYLVASENFMARAAEGDPVRSDSSFLVLPFIGIACVISLVITMVQWGKMKNVALQSDARHYQTPEGLVLTACEDIYLHTRVTRRKIESSSSSGSHSGGGGSGRSGKF